MKRILVTGANGQLGEALKNVATGSDNGVENTDLEWIFAGRDELDVTDRGAVEAFFVREQPDLIVNCAAYTDVDGAETEREKAFEVNYDGARFLAEAAADKGLSLIHLSTDYLFDGRQDTPYTESDIPNPINVYGESKLAGAMTVLESGCRGAVLRTSLVYSPRGRNFAKSILAKAKDNDTLEVVSDLRACPTYAASLARAIVAMIPSLLANPDIAEVYHYCDEGVVSRADLAAEIVRQAGLKCHIVPVPSSRFPGAAKRPAYSALDTTKFSRDFGFVPPFWKESLAECIGAMKDEC